MTILAGRPRRTAPRAGAARGARPLGLPRVLLIAAWVVFGAVLIAFWPRPLGGVTTVVRVAGESMAPTYATGDLLVAREDDAHAVGDVIVFDVPGGGPGAGMRVVHRIVASADSEWGTVYTTRGDARGEDDQWQIHDQDVLGAIDLHLAHSGEVVSAATDPKVIAVGAGVVVTLLLWPRGRRRDDDPECTEGCPDDCPGTDEPAPGVGTPVTAAPAPDPATARGGAATADDASHDGSLDYSAPSADTPSVPGRPR